MNNDNIKAIGPNIRKEYKSMSNNFILSYS